METIWSDQEDKLLKELYPENDTFTLLEILFKNERQIRKRAFDLGIKKSKKFLSNQKTRLGTKNRKCSIDDCDKKHFAIGFCRNHYSLFSRGTIDANGVGVVGNYSNWTDDEINLLKDIWPENTLKDIEQFFPSKTANSLKNKASDLQLKKSIAGNKKCHKEKITEDFRIKQSCVQQGIPIEEFNGFVTALNIRIRQSEKYKTWRASIYLRDNFTCQKCLTKSSGNLNAHHIKHLYLLISEYPEKEINIDSDYFYDINNGITLCESCHENLHKEKGYK